MQERARLPFQGLVIFISDFVRSKVTKVAEITNTRNVRIKV